jgi:hypothetical protein
MYNDFYTQNSDSKCRTARKGQPGKNSQDRTVKKGQWTWQVRKEQPGQDSQGRSARKGQSELHSQKVKITKGQPVQDWPERTARIGLLDLEYFIGRAARTGQSGHQRVKSQKNPGNSIPRQFFLFKPTFRKFIFSICAAEMVILILEILALCILSKKP